MLKFLKALFEPSLTPKSTSEDRERFARLLLTEVKLHDEKLLQGLSQDLALVDELRTTLKRAYQLYAQRTDASPEGAATFREAAVRILANGNATLLEPALSEVLREAG